MEYTKVESMGMDNRVYETGAIRDSEAGKGRQDLIPYEPLRRLAVHYENGAKKYGDRNWEKGQDMAGHLRSAFRHLTQFMNGENNEDHLSACVWNIFSFIATEKWVIEGVLDSDKDIINSLHPIIKKRIEEARHQYNVKRKMQEIGEEIKGELDKNFAGVLRSRMTGEPCKVEPEIKVGTLVRVKNNPEQYFAGRILWVNSMKAMAGRVFRVEGITTIRKETIVKLRNDTGIAWWFTLDSVERV